MKFLEKLFGKKKLKKVLIVQCRLSSTRLPRKALLPLGDKTVLEWVLAAMKEVKADKYYLATDTDSAPELEPVAKKCKWDFFAGSKEDVLDRFCKVIELSKADVVIRATADNPFLFYEAAQALLDEYLQRESTSPVDYITWSNLPHGSGIEVFNAHSLLRARTQTDLPYDHEHVGPALYNHQDKFSAVFLKSPARWSYPDLITTIDTPADYRRAHALVRAISGKQKIEKPYTTEEILSGFKNDSVQNPVIFIPSVVKGKGTGHLRRCLSLAVKTGGDVFIPRDFTLEQTQALVEEYKTNGLEDWQIVKDASNITDYSLIVTDLFKTDDKIVALLPKDKIIATIDEGREDVAYSDYVLDIIPSVNLSRKANLTEPGFISLPEQHKNQSTNIVAIHTALVSLGGEDPAGLTFPAARALASCNIYVTVIVNSLENVKQFIPEELSKYIKPILTVQNLSEKLFEYDLIVTHYGFTAFEAASAGCAVILLGTTELHQRLAENYNFVCIPSDSINKENVKKYIDNPKSLYHTIASKKCIPLSDFIIALSQSKKNLCPICQTVQKQSDVVLSRTKTKTYRRCQKCGMIYLSWKLDSKDTQYNREYFYEDYQKQYGKTYLEDFASIKAQCVRRTSVIDFLYRHSRSPVTPTILDIGCAMGPFLDAANDSGWQVFGIDVSKDAVEYVQNTLHYPAVCASFPKFDALTEFGISKFDAVTMWYVIEHFKDLNSVLKAVSKNIKLNGIFAFSTPSCSGVSYKYYQEKFFQDSPSDHYSIWEIKKTNSILEKYGFKVVRVISTGIHPERMPIVKKHNWKEKSIQFAFFRTLCKILKLGDTFEVYCKKISDIEK
ncbi:MAG: methyltransferase domain-containing protein [Treponema sp.]